ncbi:MAG TPA: oligopeptide ABC transporter ATP-binding protein OppF, partial [Clostridiales bacterium]|nr:oligopeptide ABC transporter ATP-binding protein OppF [Clostridiales bacterium]
MSMDPLLQVRDLKKYFYISGNRVLKAIDGISFDIRKGETFGLVGESGCGKTTTGRVITRLYPPTAGQVLYEGKNIFHMDKKEAREYSSRMQIIFQDP